VVSCAFRAPLYIEWSPHIRVNNVAIETIPLGSVVTVEAKVSRAFKEFDGDFIDIWIEDRESGNKTKANEAIYTFVAVDDTGRPVEVPKFRNGTRTRAF
jgi:acyl-CoA hydrolase